MKDYRFLYIASSECGIKQMSGDLSHSATLGILQKNYKEQTLTEE